MSVVCEALRSINLKASVAKLIAVDICAVSPKSLPLKLFTTKVAKIFILYLLNPESRATNALLPLSFEGDEIRKA